jgi:Uma2 family endonuclease
MSSVPRRHHRYTYADYADLETYSVVKHEFADGEIYAMSGGTAEHSALAFRMLRALDDAVADRPCTVYASDLRIHIESVGLSTYPDGCVIWGPVQEYGAGPTSTALNPMILVEVTSDSSEDYDTGMKLDYYRAIPTLRDYIIVSHRERRITVHSRGADGIWNARTVTRGENVDVTSLGARLSVDEIYRNSSI